MIKDLIKLADNLDKAGNFSEADRIDLLIRRYAQSIPESPSQQLMTEQQGTTPVQNKSLERLQIQEKEGRYVLKASLPYDTFVVGQFKPEEIPQVVNEIISGKRLVEGAKENQAYDFSSFRVMSYYLKDGVPRSQQHNLLDSPVVAPFLSKLKGYSATPKKVISPAEQIINEGYDSYKERFKSCVTTQVNGDPNFGVVAKISFTVNQDGSTSNHSAVSTPANPAFDACLKQKMIDWRFGRISLNPKEGSGQIAIEKPINISRNQRFGREK